MNDTVSELNSISADVRRATSDSEKKKLLKQFEFEYGDFERQYRRVIRAIDPDDPDHSSGFFSELYETLYQLRDELVGSLVK